MLAARFSAVNQKVYEDPTLPRIGTDCFATALSEAARDPTLPRYGTDCRPGS
jgi:hypothetical protein